MEVFKKESVVFKLTFLKTLPIPLCGKRFQDGREGQLEPWGKDVISVNSVRDGRCPD